MSLAGTGRHWAACAISCSRSRRPNSSQAIQEAGYTEPTPIQAAAIPEVLAGHDVIGIAQTGTGKTAAFTLPMLHQLAGA